MDLKDLLIRTVIRQNIYESLSAPFQGVKRLFALAYTVSADATNNEAGIKNNKTVFSSERRDSKV